MTIECANKNTDPSGWAVQIIMGQSVGAERIRDELLRAYRIRSQVGHLFDLAEKGGKAAIVMLAELWNGSERTARLMELAGLSLCSKCSGGFSIICRQCNGVGFEFDDEGYDNAVDRAFDTSKSHLMVQRLQADMASALDSGLILFCDCLAHAEPKEFRNCPDCAGTGIVPAFDD